MEPIIIGILSPPPAPEIHSYSNHPTLLVTLFWYFPHQGRHMEGKFEEIVQIFKDEYNNINNNPLAQLPIEGWRLPTDY